jgi:hypothetical protein
MAKVCEYVYLVVMKPFCLVIDEIDLNENQEATKVYAEYNNSTLFLQEEVQSISIQRGI